MNSFTDDTSSDKKIKPKGLDSQGLIVIGDRTA